MNREAQNTSRPEARKVDDQTNFASGFSSERSSVMNRTTFCRHFMCAGSREKGKERGAVLHVPGKAGNSPTPHGWRARRLSSRVVTHHERLRALHVMYSSPSNLIMYCNTKSNTTTRVANCLSSFYEYQVQGCGAYIVGMCTPNYLTAWRWRPYAVWRER